MRRPGGSGCRRLLGGSGRRLSGGIGKSAEGLGVADGDVGQHLAIQLDAGELQAVDERPVAQTVLPGRGVDPHDPQAAEVALAGAPVAIRVGVGLHDRFLGALVVGVRLAAEALGALERRLALLARVDRALDPRHEPSPSSFLTRLESDRLSSLGCENDRFRLGDFFSRMWLELACRPWTLPLAVSLKRFFAPEWVFLFGMRTGEDSEGATSRTRRGSGCPGCRPWRRTASRGP